MASRHLKTSVWISLVCHAIALPLLFGLTVKPSKPPSETRVLLLLPAPEEVVVAEAKPETPKAIPPSAPPRESKKVEPTKIVKPEPVAIVEPKTEPAPTVPATIAAALPATNSLAVAEVAESSAAPAAVSETTVAIPTTKSSRITSAQPRYRENPEPPYPLQAKRRHQEGSVLLLVSVNETGAPTKVEVKQSSGFSLLDEAAVQAVRRWKFEPGKRDERAVGSEVEVPLRFKLSGE
ncbi:MAG: energy transducer TonB [Verrucomicrobiota bacterium]